MKRRVKIPKDTSEFGDWSPDWREFVFKLDGKVIDCDAIRMFGHDGYYINDQDYRLLATQAIVTPWVPKKWTTSALIKALKPMQCNCDMLLILRGAKHQCGVF